MKPTKLTQRRRIENYVKQIASHLDDPLLDEEVDPLNGLAQLLGHLARVLGEVHRKPDGSVSPNMVTAALRVGAATKALKEACDLFMETT